MLVAPLAVPVSTPPSSAVTPGDSYTYTPPFRHGALVSTSWGPAALIWRHPAQAASAFAEPPAAALLTRILTPGLSEAALRTQLRAAAAAEVLPHAGRFHPGTVPPWFPELCAYLQGYFAATFREPGEFLDVWAYWKPHLDLAALTPFQLRVLSRVAAIPRGQVLTYGQVAQQLGRPQAARAVGAALRANPWPILIPCHRVLGAGGQLTGFTAPGGVGAKKRLLDMEASGRCT